MTDSSAPHAIDRLVVDSGLVRGLDVIARTIAFIGVLAMIFAASLTVVEVLFRWLLNSGFNGANEIVEVTFAVAITATMPASTLRGAHLSIELLTHWFSPRLSAWLAAAGSFILVALFAVLAWRILDVADSYVAQNRMTVVLRIPVAPFIYAAASLLAFATVTQLVVAVDMVRRAVAATRAFRPGTLSPINRWTARVTLLVIAVIALGLAAIVWDFDAASAFVQNWQLLSLGIAFALMWLGLLLLVPLAAVLAFVGIIGSSLFIGLEPTLSTFATEATGFLVNYQIATLPLFLLMGSFATVAGVSTDVYRLGQAILGSLRGGLALATIVGCAGFGTVTGSSLATVATFGRIALPEMRSRGYAPALAAGCVAAGGNLGALIPPSSALIVFALLTEASIGQLFVAAVVPGVVAMIFYIFAVMIYVRLSPRSVPEAAKTQSAALLSALRQSGPMFLLFGTVIGGMYSGVFTATEAAAVGAFMAFLTALLRGRLRLGTLVSVLAETTVATAMVFAIIFGALMFSFFIGITALPDLMTNVMGHLNVPPLLVIALILVIFLGLGCVMDSFSIMVITVPIMLPLITALGFDIIWWGIINLAVVEVSLITPPFGIHVFVLKAMVPDIPITTVFKGVLPFCVADFIKLALLVLFPAIALWLPSTMFG